MKENPTNAPSETRTRAELSQWESEGGTAASATPAPANDGLLLRLGAALVSEWSNLPMPLQRAVYARAVDGLATDEQKALKRLMARFLHQHKSPSPRA